MNAFHAIGLALLIFFHSTHAKDLWTLSPAENTIGAYNVTVNPLAISDLHNNLEVSIPLPHGRLTLDVKTLVTEKSVTEIAGRFEENKHSAFYLSVNNNVVIGLFHEGNYRYGFEFDHENTNLPLRKKFNNVQRTLLEELDAKANTTDSNSIPGFEELINAPEVSLTSNTTLSLQSLPDASTVFYLDFDGEVETGFRASTYNSGNPIVSAPFDLDGNPSSLNQEELDYIETVFNGVSEDFSIFNVNVTTDATIYSGAAENTRMKIVITETCEWFYNCVYGGIGPHSPWNSSGISSPGYVWPLRFTTPRLPQGTSQDISHEFGHGLQLHHDGKLSGFEYYAGNKDWAPIMGYTNFPKAMTTWSKGEYPSANQQEDDIAIVGSLIGLRYDTNEQAKGEGTHHGVIGSYDEDQYTFFAKPGDIVEIDAYGAEGAGISNLNIRLQLRDPDGNLVADVDHDSSPNASLTHSPTKTR